MKVSALGLLMEVIINASEKCGLMRLGDSLAQSLGDDLV